MVDKNIFAGLKVGLEMQKVGFKMPKVWLKKIVFKNGLIDSLQAFYPNGNLMYEASLKEGELLYCFNKFPHLYLN